LHLELVKYFGQFRWFSEGWFGEGRHGGGWFTFSRTSRVALSGVREPFFLATVASRCTFRF
jgi:hypothetical protein